MPIPSVDATTAAYFAGLFDGEGWIKVDVKPGKRGGYAVLFVGLGSTDLSIPPLMQNLFGGHISKVRIPSKVSRRLMQQWGATNDTASDFLKTIYPYMVIKARQAALAFKFRKIQVQSRWQHNTHRHALLMELAEELHSLNKGIAPHVQTVKGTPQIAGMIQSEVLA